MNNRNDDSPPPPPPPVTTHAFGKEPPPAGLPSFGASFIPPEQSFSAPRGGSGGSRREYVETWRFPLGVSISFVLIPGSYKNKVAIPRLAADGSQMRGPNNEALYTIQEVTELYKRGVDHYDEYAPGTRKSFVCAAPEYPYADANSAALCGGCRVIHENTKWDDKARRYVTKGSLTRRAGRAFGIAILHPFYAVPSTRMDRRGQPYMDYKMGQGRNCPYAAQGLPRIDGRRFVFNASMTNFRELVGGRGYEGAASFQGILRKNCVSCGGNRMIDTRSWNCPNCQHEVIDMANTSLTDAEIDNRVQQRLPCPACRQTMQLVEVIECKQCKHPHRASLFDGVITATARANKATETGKNTGTSLSFQYWTPLPADSPYRKLLETPLDLDTIRGPAPVDLQIQVCGKGPLGHEQNAAHSESYGNDDNVPFLNRVQATSRRCLRVVAGLFF